MTPSEHHDHEREETTRILGGESDQADEEVDERQAQGEDTYDPARGFEPVEHPDGEQTES